MAIDPEVDDRDTEDRPKELRIALRRWKLAEEAETKQREAELEDLRFVDDPDGQWPADIRKLRMSQNIDGTIVAARPTLTIDKITPAIDQVCNQASNARLSVKVKPRGSKANQQTAEVLQGLYRNIEVESRAHRARMWAFRRAVECGRGYYRVLTKYSNDGDDDLDIVIAPILNQHAVRIDPHHQQPDGSDAMWAFVAEDVPFDTFKQKYSNSQFARVQSDEELTGLGDEAPGWVGGDSKESRTVRVAEYWHVDIKTHTLYLTDQGWFKKADIPAGATKLQRENADGEMVDRTRDVDVRQVKWCKLTSAEILEEQNWDGRYIPIVQVVGNETNINGERRYRGVVSKAKDANRMFNVMFSRMMETIGLASNAPWIVVEGQLEGYEKQWAAASSVNLPYLTHRSVNLRGEPAPPPQRNVAEPPIAAISQAIAQSQDAVQSATQTFDPSLGKGQGRNQSGRAIAELQQQSEQGNSNYLENLASDSMAHEARIVLDLVKYVYDRPGRIAQILGEDDQPTDVMLNQPFVKGPDGRPTPAPLAGAPGVEHYDLTAGEYAVTVAIGKSFSTLREEQNAMMGQIAQAAPQMLPLYADLWVRSMDFPGKDEIADRLKKMLPPNLQEQGEGGQQDPAALAAQNQQLQMQLQQMGAELQKSQAGIDKVQIQTESKERIEAAKLASEREIEEMRLRVKQLENIVKANIAQGKLESDEARDAMKATVELEKHHAQLQQQDRLTDKTFVQQRTLQAEKPNGNGGKA